MKKITDALKLKKVWIPIAAILLIVVLKVSFGGQSAPKLSTATVKRGPITEAVFVTGAVKAQDTADLAFEKSGKVTSIAVDVGSHVYRGELLASLSSDTEYANVQSAEARLRSQQAHLADLEQGARPEDIAVTESDLDAAELQLSNSYANIATTLQDAGNKADDAVSHQADPLFLSAQSQNPRLSFTSTSQDAETKATRGRANAGIALAGLQADISAAASATDPAAQKDSLTKASGYLATIQQFLSDSAAVLSYEAGLSDSASASYMAGVNAGRANITAALTSISSLSQQLGGNEVAVQKIQAQLALKKLGATPDAIAVQQAQVDSAQADVLAAQAAYAKDFMHAPTSGTITQKNIEVGEIAGANSPAISMQADGAFRLEASVPEADIAKIVPGNSASTTLDAYGSAVSFGASVVSIDPSEKIVDGVATYKVTLDFAKNDARVKSGMTANITIVTDERADALQIPQRAVVTQDGKSIVHVVAADGKTTADRAVTTGIRGEDGSIEILSGLKEGEVVTTFIAS